MTLFEHSVAFHQHYRSWSFACVVGCDSSWVTHCHALLSCISMVMHQDLLGPDSMHYEHFNCISNWPVSVRCQKSLEELIAVDSHNINPLPAYDIDHTCLPPSKYMDKLPGATALISMAFAHHHVKQSKRHIFNAICHELVIVREAHDLPSSPYKKGGLPVNLY